MDFGGIFAGEAKYLDLISYNITEFKPKLMM